MQVSVESTGALERRLTVTVDTTQISSAVDERLKKLSRTVKLKGFRAGKVPMHMVQQYYGQQVQQEVLGDVMQSSFYEAIRQEKLRPAGYPNFQAKPATATGEFQYTATFEVYPEIKLADSKSLKIEKPTTSITDQDVSNMIETIRKQHHDWVHVDRPAQKGDRVIVDFSGESNGKPIAGGQGKSYPVEIGTGRMIAGFEDGLIGCRANDEKDLALNFPEQYHAKELAGKPANFHIKVISVEESLPPRDDAELAKRLGIEQGDAQKMRDEIRQNMQRELDNAISNKLKQLVMDALIAANPLDLPKALVEDESKHLAEQMANNLIRQGMPKEQATLQHSVFAEQAQRRVALGLILAEIIKVQDIKADADQVRKKVEDIAAPYERPQEVVSWYYADKRRLSEIESLVLEQKVVDWVLTNAKCSEKPTSFDEMLNPKK